jgi:hypothetical protein
MPLEKQLRVECCENDPMKANDARVGEALQSRDLLVNTLVLPYGVSWQELQGHGFIVLPNSTPIHFSKSTLTQKLLCDEAAFLFMLESPWGSW